jgi:thioredoxin-related protein
MSSNEECCNFCKEATKQLKELKELKEYIKELEESNNFYESIYVECIKELKEDEEPNNKIEILEKE